MSVRDVLLCRDCCCGTERKHPDVDHAAQEKRLLAACDRSGATLRRTSCLNRCEVSNLIVLRTTRGPLWLGRVLDAQLTEEIAALIESGAEGPLSPALAACSVEPGDAVVCDAGVPTRAEVRLAPPLDGEAMSTSQPGGAPADGREFGDQRCGLRLQLPSERGEVKHRTRTDDGA